MRIAVWQAQGPDAGAVRLADAAARAAAAGADVVVTPELFATGYGRPFGPPDPDLVGRWQEIAASYRIEVVGTWPQGGDYITVVVRAGVIHAGRYRKYHSCNAATSDV